MRSRLSTKCTLRPTAQRRTKDVCKRYYKHGNNNNTKTYNTAVDVDVNLFTIEIEFTVTVIEVISHVDCSLFSLVQLLIFQVTQLLQKRLRSSLKVLDLEAGQGLL